MQVILGKNFLYQTSVFYQSITLPFLRYPYSIWSDKCCHFKVSFKKLVIFVALKYFDGRFWCYINAMSFSGQNQIYLILKKLTFLLQTYTSVNEKVHF